MESGLLAFGASLLTFYAVAHIQSTVLARIAVQRFGASTPSSLTSKKPERKLDSPSVNFILWSEPRIDAYKKTLAQHLLPALAVLRVQKIELEVPVLEGTDDLTLNRGTGWIRGTARPEQWGNIGIAGHRDGFFRGLKDLKMGDTMDLVTHDRTDTCVVDDIRIVNPDDVSVLRPGVARSLTLVTCYPFYFVGSAPQRYVVHASILRSPALNTLNTATHGESIRQ
jgi:sortase A